jgi:hypothetical protein
MKVLSVMLPLALTSVKAFNPIAGTAQRAQRYQPLYQKVSPKEEEMKLRREIATTNSAVSDEAKYSLRDAEGMRGAFISEPMDEPTSESSSFAAKMERIMRPRAYPLFLAEKAAELVEHSLNDLVKGSSLESQPNGFKEKIVVLGTGWGAASFLKDVDTSKYDVTVISPRNYFLFTPMLAGASVGTVEFRSITEPIREVRVNIMSLTTHS